MYYQLATMPGDDTKPNEDLVGTLGNYAVLLDGAGGPGELPTGCIHGVPWFVRQLGSQALMAMASGNQGEPLAVILSTAIANVMAAHAATCDLDVPGTPSSTVVMARIGGEAVDYLVLGDSALIVQTLPGITVVSDRRLDEVAPPEYRQMLALPTGTPEHQAARLAFVRRQQPTRNRPGGYPIASTDPGAAMKAITGSIALGEVRRLALASDGVTRFAEFGLGTWEDMLNVLSAGGARGLFGRIRDAENSDPQGRAWPRAKQHDDVGVVFWERS